MKLTFVLIMVVALTLTNIFAEDAEKPDSNVDQKSSREDPKQNFKTDDAEEFYDNYSESEANDEDENERTTPKPPDAKKTFKLNKYLENRNEEGKFNEEKLLKIPSIKNTGDTTQEKISMRDYSFEEEQQLRDRPVSKEWISSEIIEETDPYLGGWPYEIRQQSREFVFPRYNNYVPNYFPYPFRPPPPPFQQLPEIPLQEEFIRNPYEIPNNFRYYN